MREVLGDKVRRGDQEIDILNWMSRAALEFVGIGGLGYSFEALDEKSENVYGKATKEDADLHSVIPPRCVIPQLKLEFFRSPFFRRFHIQRA